MNRTLDVYLHNSLVGYLEQDQGGQMSFTYSKQWLDNPKAHALSWSLPLRKESFAQKECRGFFAGLLPEESNRNSIALILGISARNDYAMLEQIGGECAGAITFIPAGTPLPKPPYEYRPLDREQLSELLQKLPQYPLLAGTPDLRLSLAGAQNKIAVHIDENEQISLPLGGAPSSHILKPTPERFAHLARNEAFCLKLAKAIGIPAVEVETDLAGDIEYLLIQRYDRTQGTRLHQEDFCQALGTTPERKYQGEGGPSLPHCFTLLREASLLPAIDIQHLLNMAIFNIIVGNHDAHGKNFSLLYSEEKIRLAPAYDILSTIYYPELTPKMAMKIGKEYKSQKLTLKSIEQFATDAGLGKAAVRHRVGEMTTRVQKKLPAIQGIYAFDDLAALIEKRAKWLLNIVT